MQINVVTAQAETLREWASQWEREALALDDGAACTEVATLLRQAATQALRAAGAPDDEQETVALRPAAPPRRSVRAG